ncbi:MAG TPA: ribosome maturation factor RimM [Solirubrobacteraceae bacterium]|nr:ribosome maturation factor RimM [Solirubrobacteraceae bacterium]
MSAPGYLHAGRVGRPHGLDGSFHVLEPTPRLLQAGATLRVSERETPVERRAGTDERPIVRLGLAGDRDGAQALRGCQLLAPRAAAPGLEEGEFWAEDLEGCSVTSADGRVLGRVGRLVALPSCEALELEDGTLIPLVRDAVTRVDVAARRVEVDMGFLGLGA